MLFEPTQTSIFIFWRLSILSFQLFCNHNPSCDKCLQVGDCVILGHINAHKCANWEGEATPKNAHGSSSRLSSCKSLPWIHIYISLRNVQRYVHIWMNDAWVLHNTCKIVLITWIEYKSRQSVKWLKTGRRLEGYFMNSILLASKTVLVLFSHRFS